MMSKSIVPVSILLLVILTPVDLLAQEVKFGLKGGLNSSWIGDDPAESESVLGVNVAFFTELQFSGRISAILDLGMNQRGFQRVQNETTDAGELIGKRKAKTRLSYFTMSPQLNVHLSKTHWRPYFGAGPRFDFLADRKPGEFEFSEVTVPDETADLMEQVVIGSILSAGIKHGSSDGFQWKLELRYDRDFTDSIPEFPGLFRSNSVVLLFGISF